MFLLMLVQLHGLASTAATAARRRLEQIQDPRDAGLTTLEIVVIALGLFLIAGVAVVVIRQATQSRLDQIN